MALVIINIINPVEETSGDDCAYCSKCQQKFENLQTLQHQEYCKPCYNETVRDIMEKLPNITPQLEIVK